MKPAANSTCSHDNGSRAAVPGLLYTSPSAASQEKDAECRHTTTGATVFDFPRSYLTEYKHCFRFSSVLLQLAVRTTSRLTASACLARLLADPATQSRGSGDPESSGPSDSSLSSTPIRSRVISRLIHSLKTFVCSSSLRRVDRQCQVCLSSTTSA